MKIFARKRGQTINKYIILSQVLFFLLIGILLFRTSNLVYETMYFKLQTTFFFALILGLIPFLQMINLHVDHNQIIWDFIITGIYILLAVAFLSHENEDLFKIVLLMPVLIVALKYGVKIAICTAFVAVSVLVIVGYFHGFVSIDADIVFGSVLFLLAWLLGNMTETDYEIRNELERLAHYDGLTDIYNHRSFQHLLNEAIQGAVKDKSRVSLILLDIDYFKYYNDAYGHQKGDEILKELAGILRDVTGSLGYCARYGGEEFAVILPGLNISVAKQLGEEIRRRIEETEFPGRDVFPESRLTVSVGIAEYPTNADTRERLIKKADEALYRAKFVSKNRVESYYSIFDEMGLALKEEEKELFNSISAFTMIINAKDRYTYGHSLRVMDMAKMLAIRLELDTSLIHEISFGAILHDIGKIEISREVLNKPTSLNEKEWELFHNHPKWGAEIIDPLKSLKETKKIILHHHENFDGTGYPQGIQGIDIPVGARILRIVDSFDAITTNRPYKEAMSTEQALEELARYSGVFYDPWVLEEFIQMMREEIKKEN